MKDFVTSKFRLPDLNGIRIEWISDNEDADLASFLSDYTPSQLRLLTINFCFNSYNSIKSKFYIYSFSKAVAKTTKEVYFTWIDFSAEDLQTVIRAARNAERIVFYFCCIHCSPDLDFGADLSYNTKFLGFQQWGDMDIEERTTDWKEDPSCFSLIVDAIGSSGLKSSLLKVDIAYNMTLSKSKVQEEFNAKDMPHISVVEEFVNPLSF